MEEDIEAGRAGRRRPWWPRSCRAGPRWPRRAGRLSRIALAGRFAWTAEVDAELVVVRPEVEQPTRELGALSRNMYFDTRRRATSWFSVATRCSPPRRCPTAMANVTSSRNFSTVRKQSRLAALAPFGYK
jgi:hypothetical protein